MSPKLVKKCPEGRISAFTRARYDNLQTFDAAKKKIAVPIPIFEFVLFPSAPRLWLMQMI